MVSRIFVELFGVETLKGICDTVNPLGVFRLLPGCRHSEGASIPGRRDRNSEKISMPRASKSKNAWRPLRDRDGEDNRAQFFRLEIFLKFLKLIDRCINPAKQDRLGQEPQTA